MDLVVKHRKVKCPRGILIERKKRKCKMRDHADAKCTTLLIVLSYFFSLKNTEHIFVVSSNLLALLRDT
jgi:hypothetical protein